MSDGIREILRDLVAARQDRSVERVARALHADARYWDCERGEVDGREGVAEALTARAARLEVETLAASGDEAVVEVRVHEPGREHRSTEVYRLADAAIVSVSAYFDPEARGG